MMVTIIQPKLNLKFLTIFKGASKGKMNTLPDRYMPSAEHIDFNVLALQTTALNHFSMIIAMPIPPPIHMEIRPVE